MIQIKLILSKGQQHLVKDYCLQLSVIEQEVYIACTTEEADKLSSIDGNEFIVNWYLLEAMQAKQLENVSKSNFLVAEASTSMAGAEKTPLGSSIDSR